MTKECLEVEWRIVEGATWAGLVLFLLCIVVGQVGLAVGSMAVMAAGWLKRLCGACGVACPLGEGEYDPCLGVLPGVDNACCGHGVRDESYVRFTTGVVLRGFTVEHVEKDNHE